MNLWIEEDDWIELLNSYVSLMKELNVMLQKLQELNINEQLLALMDLLMQCMFHRTEQRWV